MSNILWLYVNMLTLSTPYQIEKTEILKTSMTFSARSTIEKNRKKRKNVFTTNVALVPKITVWKKKRAPLQRRHLPSPNTAGRFVFVTGWTGCVLPWKDPKQWETPIKYRKCPTFDANRNVGDFQFQLIDKWTFIHERNFIKTDEQMNKNLTEISDLNIRM